MHVSEHLNVFPNPKSGKRSLVLKHSTHHQYEKKSNKKCRTANYFRNVCHDLSSTRGLDDRGRVWYHLGYGAFERDGAAT
jgi:hypothetical protein